MLTIWLHLQHEYRLSTVVFSLAIKLNASQNSGGRNERCGDSRVLLDEALGFTACTEEYGFWAGIEPMSRRSDLCIALFQRKGTNIFVAGLSCQLGKKHLRPLHRVQRAQVLQQRVDRLEDSVRIVYSVAAGTRLIFFRICRRDGLAGLYCSICQ